MKGCMEACSPEEKLVRLLAKKQMTITTAESCTGGLDRRNDRECGRRVGCAE